MCTRSMCGKNARADLYGYKSASDPALNCNAHLLPPEATWPGNVCQNWDINSLYGKACKYLNYFSSAQMSPPQNGLSFRLPTTTTEAEDNFLKEVAFFGLLKKSPL
jgi:hypothetical protein